MHYMIQDECSIATKMDSHWMETCYEMRARCSNTVVVCVIVSGDFMLLYPAYPRQLMAVRMI